MAYNVDDTIVAIASPPGASLRGIIRISGEQTFEILQRYFERVSLTNIQDAHNVAVDCEFAIDDTHSVSGQLLMWPTKKSFTRQPSAELHTVGATPILQMLLERLVSFGCRLAEPGEFTMRAFLSGRIDLTQAEAVLGVIDSTNKRQFKNSLQQLAGGISTPLTKCRDSLLSLLAELEAGLDFVEEDIEFISNDELVTLLSESETIVQNTITQLESRQTKTDQIKVVLAGKPNAGKSSLFNALINNEKQSAIVTNIAGTTRDYITANIEIESSPIQLIDTAGVELSSNPPTVSDSIDNEMQTQSNFKIADADLLILCSAGEFEDVDRSFSESNNQKTLWVATKHDLRKTATTTTAISVSSVDGTGIENLRERIGEMAGQIQSADVSVASTATRTFDSLVTTKQSIGRAITAAQSGLGEEIVAAEIRESLEHLGRIVGVVYTDDILDLVFSRFCIGK